MSTAQIDAYLKKTTEPQRSTLDAVRKTLRKLLPSAQEGLSYGAPAFLVDGKAVAAFAAASTHCSYFPMSGTVLAKLKAQLGKLQASKGALKFPVDEPLSTPLLRKLIKARLAEASAPKKNGRATAYYENGVVASRGAYKGGKMHGKWEFFRKDTSLMRSGSFTSGKRCGTWRTFDRQGRLVTETEL